ncbi:MAG TPA: YgjP-like metallopeptidase domain-containing protein [Candidatus Nanoarchaeia archaeon]|nr:YgjP-like metallopeptidase domain-containing protein [Candidatus Nanoarchaeia archaeon]
MRTDVILIDGKEYHVSIIVEQRSNSRASIGKRGVMIRLPRDMPREMIARDILRMKKWAMDKLRDRLKNTKDKPIELSKGTRTYSHGDAFSIAGEDYKIMLSFFDKQSSSVRIVENTIFFSLSNRISEETKNQHISVLLSRIMAKKKKNFMANKVKMLNEKHFHFTIGKIFLKYNTSNWGSCSSSNNINLSTRLLFAPDDVIDYVCIHELAHVQEKNHSATFWALVEKAMPNYKEKKQWLRDNTNKCWF